MPSLTTQTRFEPLNQPVSTQDVALYRKNGGRNSGSSWIALIAILAVLAACFLIAFIVNVSTEFFDGSISRSDLKEASVALTISAVLSALIVPLYYLNKSASIKNTAHRVRMQRFAKANNWTYHEAFQPLERPGMIFNEGIERYNDFYVESTEGQNFSYGVYSYVTGAGKGRVTNIWSYVSVPITASLPHIVLDAKANNIRIFGTELATSLAHEFDKDMQVSLSPEADDLYTSYTSDKNAATVAKYITPEFITALQAIDGRYDIEIVDGVVYAYSLGHLNSNEASMKNTLKLVELLSNTFNGVVKEEKSSTPLTDSLQKDVKLAGKTPTFVIRLAMIAVVIQFVTLIAILVY